MQMEKELNHVPRREIDRSVEVLHFFEKRPCTQPLSFGSHARAQDRRSGVVCTDQVELRWGVHSQGTCLGASCTQPLTFGLYLSTRAVEFLGRAAAL